MSANRFVGATVRDCLRRVKEVLGPDAVVISNRAVENGVEIIAMSPERPGCHIAADAAGRKNICNTLFGSSVGGSAAQPLNGPLGASPAARRRG
jgi:flagellar biosynthesis protein FlhF